MKKIHILRLFFFFVCIKNLNLLCCLYVFLKSPFFINPISVEPDVKPTEFSFTILLLKKYILCKKYIIQKADISDKQIGNAHFFKVNLRRHILYEIYVDTIPVLLFFLQKHTRQRRLQFVLKNTRFSKLLYNGQQKINYNLNTN